MESTDRNLAGSPPSPPLPRHIAIILDGNGRWAAARGLPRTKGHEHGASAVRKAVQGCRERGIRYLTLYAFSVANWSRPKEEIDGLMRVCAEFAERERADLIERGIAVEAIGDLEEIPTPTRRAMESLLRDTAGGKAMTLSLALSYGGRRDMVNAMRALAVRARAGLVIPEEINEESLRSFLTTSSLPDPDLVIRTGGEKRLSDFLLFESAYAELFFTSTLWPDFTEAVLDEAIAAFGRRERRYGKVDGERRYAVAG
jgi:undecaprenyl diphosphate synthase